MAEIARSVHAGKYVEFPWTLFRLQHLPGMDDVDAARTLAACCAERDVAVDFEVRHVREHPVIAVLFTRG